MALAEYYERAALAASQIIAGFAPDLFRRTLEQANVGLTIDKEAATSDEGKALADLAVRLLARLYQLEHPHFSHHARAASHRGHRDGEL